MRSALLVLALAACRPDMAERAPPPDATPRGFRIATYNVHRLFDPVCDSGTCGGGAYEELPSPAAFAAQAAQIADAIRGLDADVVALEEVESQACLDALLARVGDAMPYGVLGEIGTAASVDVGVLSRTPIEAVVGHRASEPLALPSGEVTSFARELLEVHVRTPSGAPVVLFAAHFKSKSSDDPARRLAEAQQAARDVLAVAADQPDALVALAGDLNDTPGSPPLAALVGSGLVRVADDLAPADQATYYYRGRGEAIDHILIAPDPSRIPRSTRTWRSTASGWGGSDHLALSSEFAR